MFNFSSGGLDFGKGSDEAKRTEHLLVGGLALIVVGSLAFTLWYVFHTPTVKVPTEYHMFCVNCNKEVIVPVEQAPKTRNVPKGSGGAPTGGSGPMSGPPGGSPGRPPEAPSTGPAEPQRGICPICGKPALIPERICPRCKHYYVTEWDKTHGPWEVDPQADSFRCPNCGVNIAEYRKSHPYGD